MVRTVTPYTRCAIGHRRTRTHLACTRTPALCSAPKFCVRRSFGHELCAARSPATTRSPVRCCMRVSHMSCQFCFHGQSAARAPRFTVTQTCVRVYAPCCLRSHGCTFVSCSKSRHTFGTHEKMMVQSRERFQYWVPKASAAAVCSCSPSCVVVSSARTRCDNGCAADQPREITYRFPSYLGMCDRRRNRAWRAPP